MCAECNFSGTDMRGAVLGYEHYKSDFRGTDLRGIILPEDSSFEKLGCDIRGALLTTQIKGTPSNKRRQKRVTIYEPLDIYDRRTNQKTGNLKDITTKGLRMESDFPNPVGSLYYFFVPLAGDKRLNMDVKSMWCKQDQNQSSYFTGFQIERITEEGVTTIEDIIKRQESLASKKDKKKSQTAAKGAK